MFALIPLQGDGSEYTVSYTPFSLRLYKGAIAMSATSKYSQRPKLCRAPLPSPSPTKA